MQIFKSDASEEKGEGARLSSFVGAIAVGDLVKSTLGPKGMDKILQSASGRDTQVTNDGATILKWIALDNPAAKVLVNLSKVQDDEVGDGTTSVCVLAAELLREAERLIDQHRLHPQLIIEGYREAARAARAALEGAARDNSTDAAAFREDLLDIARTTLSSKILAQDKEHFARLAVDAVLRLRGPMTQTGGVVTGRVDAKATRQALKALRQSTRREVQVSLSVQRRQVGVDDETHDTSSMTILHCIHAVQD